MRLQGMALRQLSAKCSLQLRLQRAEQKRKKKKKMMMKREDIQGEQASVYCCCCCYLRPRTRHLQTAWSLERGLSLRAWGSRRASR